MYELKTPETRRRVWIPVLIVAAAAVAGAIITTVTLLTRPDGSEGRPMTLLEPPLQAAQASCSAGELADKDTTLLIDMAGEELNSGTATFADIDCVLTELEAPRSVLAQMNSTRALDGMQSATWATYEAKWTYHPDDGLDLILTQTG